jgi:AcrR family transcriptional regulator
MTSSASAGSRERVLVKALHLFAEHGYRGLSMREIADAVGFTKAALYYHFRDKEDLFGAVVHAYLLELGALVDAASANAPSCRVAVARIVQGIMGQPPEQRAIVQLVSQEMGHMTPERRAVLMAEYGELFLGRLQRVLSDGMQRGELRSVDPVVATWALLGMLQPYFSPAQTDRGARVPTEAVVDALLSIYFDGLQADSM